MLYHEESLDGWIKNFQRFDKSVEKIKDILLTSEKVGLDKGDETTNSKILLKKLSNEKLQKVIKEWEFVDEKDDDCQM